MFSLRREEIIIISVIIISCVIIGLFTISKEKRTINWETSFENDLNTLATIEPKTELFIVHIAGAVARPGVYTLKEGSRILDALLLAGGETREANLNKINLAAPLRDGSQIIIPYNTNEMESFNDIPGKININAASQTSLETLPGIGPSKAKAIIEYRLKNGYFVIIEDLMNVSGIGEKTFDSLKELIDVY